MMTEEIQVLFSLHSACLLSEGVRATVDDWRGAHRPGNKQTVIDTECVCSLRSITVENGNKNTETWKVLHMLTIARMYSGRCL